MSLTFSEDEYNTFIKDILNELQCGDSITPFDDLVSNTFAYLWMSKKNKYSKFVAANDIAIADSVIVAMFVNSRRFIDGIDNAEVKQTYVDIYFKKNFIIVKKLLPNAIIYFSEMLKNRIDFYNQVWEENARDTNAAIEKVFNEYNFIITQDVILEAYHPFCKESPLTICETTDMLLCQNETNIYKNTIMKVFTGYCNLINEVLSSIEKEKKASLVNYCAMQESLFSGLDDYIKKHKCELLHQFRDALKEYFDNFLSDNSIEEYVFSISIPSNNSISYVSFNLEESVIEVVCGGSVYDEEVGSDSFTAWSYSLWSDGNEEFTENDTEIFNDIYSLFASDNAELTIDSPDELYYYPEMEDNLESIEVSIRRKLISKIDVLRFLVDSKFEYTNDQCSIIETAKKEIQELDVWGDLLLEQDKMFDDADADKKEILSKRINLINNQIEELNDSLNDIANNKLIYDEFCICLDFMNKMEENIRRQKMDTWRNNQ